MAEHQVVILTAEGSVPSGHPKTSYALVAEWHEAPGLHPGYGSSILPGRSAVIAEAIPNSASLTTTSLGL